ncbi:hypothetical protein BaOVIS_005530 [Babesia ovis]|uniref:Uncharacterized protein n=1 Tax=Babesia ovis TaxID=5869 RepID=A0A9W5T850_BABOV|nr:hypothetical protein BaOVIS_005530 [Babesia ovis]
MAPTIGTNRGKGVTKRSTGHLSLRERLMAQGAYKPTAGDETRNNSTVPLFSPQKSVHKPTKPQKVLPLSTNPRPKSTVPPSVSQRNSLSQRKTLPKGTTKEESFAFMLDAAEVARVREASEALLSSLNSDESDYSDVQIVDTSSLDTLQAGLPTAKFGDASCIPLLNHPRGASYGMLRLPPKSHFGPMINIRGVMALLLLELESGKLFYESLNLSAKRRLPCPRQSHVLVLPDDVFKLYNESDSTEACVLMVSCRKDGKEFNIEQHVQGAFPTPVR